MDHDAPDAIPAPAPSAATPPTVRGEMPLRRPSWPTVLGIIALVLSILGLFGSVWGIAAPFVIPAIVGEHEAFDELFDVTNIVLNVVSLAVNVLLLAGAVNLLRWRLGAPRLLRAYAVAQLITGTIAMAYGTYLALAQLDAMQADLGGSSAFVSVVTVVSIAMGFLFMAAFPVILLVWFSRAAVKRDMAHWFTGGAARDT